MARLKCASCGNELELTFFEPWNCMDCGVDYFIQLLEFTSEELTSVFRFYQYIKNNIDLPAVDSTTILAKQLEDPKNPCSASFLDTLLLFFDSLIIPDLNNSDLSQIFGKEKYDLYHREGLIRTSDNSYIQATAAGMGTYRAFDGKRSSSFAWDLELLDPKLEELTMAPKLSVTYSLYYSIENLNQAYFNELKNFLFKTDLFNINSIKHTYIVKIKGQVYRDQDLVGLIPSRFLRNEIYSHIYSTDLLTDDYYGIAPALRKERYEHQQPNGAFEFKVFHEWLKSTPLKQRILNPEAVLEFREKHGSFRPFIAQLKTEIKNGSARNVHEMVKMISSELNCRIVHYEKVFSKSHDIKQIYLNGLFGTLGALVGGPVGAIIGGVGGTALSHLALEYDRSVPDQISWLASELVKSR